MKTITLYRKPTPYEIRIGEGAVHYKDFDAAALDRFVCAGRKFATAKEAVAYSDAYHRSTGIFAGVESRQKLWLLCPDDGLRYFRSRN